MRTTWAALKGWLNRLAFRAIATLVRSQLRRWDPEAEIFGVVLGQCAIFQVRFNERVAREAARQQGVAAERKLDTTLRILAAMKERAAP